MTAILLPSTPNGALGTSLTRVRQFTAAELGPFQASTASSSSTTAALVDTTWPVSSQLAQDSLYLDQFLFRPNAAQSSDMSRVVKLYTPSTGTLTPDQAWTNAPAAAESYELHGRIDPLVLNAAINEALKELMVVTELTMTPVAQAVRHDITSVAPWLVNERWVRQVGFLKNTDSRDYLDPYKFRVIRGEAEFISGHVYLAHPYIAFDPTVDTIYIKALMPAYYGCRLSSTGSWGETQGLNAEANEAPVTVDRLAAATLVILWRRYSQILEPGANSRLINDLQQAVNWKTELTDRDLEIPELTFQPMPIRWGPLQHGGLGIWEI